MQTPDDKDGFLFSLVLTLESEEHGLDRPSRMFRMSSLLLRNSLTMARPGDAEKDAASAANDELESHSLCMNDVSRHSDALRRGT